MQIRELEVPYAWSIHPKQFGDQRGIFMEWYRHEPLTEAVGHPLDLRQANCSVSAAGTVRGVHYADVPPSQAKYVTCVRGAIIDVIVDIRVGSPTFGATATVRLDDVDRAAVYLSEGLGHAFVALTDDATVVYLCSEVYNPAAEHGITPLDEGLPIAGLFDSVPELAGVEPRLSDKDLAAPTLDRARRDGLLPDHDTCQAFYRSLGR